MYYIVNKKTGQPASFIEMGTNLSPYYVVPNFGMQTEANTFFKVYVHESHKKDFEVKLNGPV